MKFMNVVLNVIVSSVMGCIAGIAAVALNALINYAAENGVINNGVLAFIWGCCVFILFEAYRWIKNKWVKFYNKLVYVPWRPAKQETGPESIDNNSFKSSFDPFLRWS